MENSKGWGKVFNGWYRKSLARKGTVWHRVRQFNSVLSSFQMGRTVCGIGLPSSKCDFKNKPDNKCMRCEKSPGVIVETGRVFVLVNEKSLLTKSAIIAELRRLIKPRTYFVRIWDEEGIKITAQWESALDISVDTEDVTITKQRKNHVMKLEYVQADLARFASQVNHICDETDALAIKQKKKNGLKGKLTEEERSEFFEDLLYKAEK